MQCPKCNYKNTENAHYCSNCAHQLIKPPPFYKRHKWLTALSILLLAFCILVVIGVISFINTISSELESESARESVITGSGDDTIALINIDGVIVENEDDQGITSFSESQTSARHIKKVLKEVSDDDSVRAIVLRINSPGGSAAASEEILSDIKRFKEEYHIPVVTYFSDMAASGGYYVALSGDKIVANPTSITGSIGVILSYMNFGELAQKYGVKNIVIKSGAHKDLASSFRDPTKEETEILQSVVDDAYDVFVKNVSNSRDLKEDEVRKLADGRIYSAKQAKENHLIDETGNFEFAVSEARKLAKIEEASVIEFGKQGFLESLLESVSSRFNQSLINLPKSEANVMYLYNPTL